MIIESYEQLVESEISQANQKEIPAALKRAYDLADALIEDTPFLSKNHSMAARGHIIQYSVDFQLIRLIESGQWPFDYHWEDYSKPTGRYLQILSKSSIITASRLQDAKQIPRKAVFRENLRLNNNPAQLTLLSDDAFVRPKKERFHLILGHGYLNPDFARLYIPHSDKKTWSWRSEDIMKQIHIIDSDLPKEERPKIKVKPEIKEEFKEWIEKNGTNYRKSQ